ncbi:MAG: hypothetical protein WCJ84_01520 [Candidatus Peregrinibacteria bacterium]
MIAAPKLSEVSFITSLRELARDATVRKKAFAQQKPVIVENRKEESFFMLFPPVLYEKLYEIYLDRRDTDDLLKAVQTDEKFVDFDAVEAEIFGIPK